MGGRLLIAVAVFLAVASLPAQAEGPECRCRYQGKYFGQGETVCIRVGGQSKLARCDMVLNNSSWTFLGNGCPSALMTPAQTPLSSTGPSTSPL